MNSPPAGLTWTQDDSRRKPFLARWRIAGTNKRPAKSFATESDRAKWSKQWQKTREDRGRAAAIVRPEVIESWQAFERIVGPGVDKLDVARFYVRNRGVADGDMLLGDAIDRLLAQHASRKVANDTRSHFKLHLTRLKAGLGARRLADITGDDVRRWLRSLEDPKTGGELAPKTLAHHLRTASYVFNRAMDGDHRWTTFNPCDGVVANENEDGDGGDDVQHRDINILTVEQARHLFAVNRDALCIGRLALEAFAGMRYSGAARLRRADLNFDDRGITMPGHQHKSGVRHYVDGWPDNLWAWLRLAPQACWDLPPRIYLELKRAAFVRAGLKPEKPANGKAWSAAERAQFKAMQNVLRHSFGTYHLAAYKNANLTLELMTKNSLRSLKHDYRGRATQAAGLAYHAIAPG